MPYAQPQDADQLFYSNFMIKFVGNAGSSPTAANIVAPSGVTVTLSATGVYTVQLPSAYVAVNPPTDAVVVPTVSSTAKTDAGYGIRYISTGSSAAAGTFVLNTFAVSDYTAPANLTSTYTAQVMIELKFATVLVNAS